MKFKVGDKVSPTESYVQHDGLDDNETAEILSLKGEVIAAFGHVTKGNTYHVRFENAPYYSDYWVMYENEIEFVED